MNTLKFGITRKGGLFKTGLLFLTICILTLGLSMPHANAVPGIIIDQDMSSDHDDVGDLAVLNALANLGECQILACMCDSQNGGTPLCQNAICTYYGYPNVPVGVRPDIEGAGGYPATIASEFPHPLYQTASQCPLAANLYRQILASQPNNSVIIVTTGYLNNLQALLQTGPDQYSSLTGSQLVAQKVKLLSCAGGQYPSGGEFNFTVEPAASSYTINNWPAAATFTGFEIGGSIDTGGQLQNTSTNNPVRAGYQLTFFGPYPSWGQIAVYNAVRPTESAFLWNFNNVGSNTVASNGVNTWVSSPNPGNQAYLLETERFPIQDALNTLIMALPNTGAASVPSQPSDLRATVSGNTINLQWTDNSYNETGFKIERRVNGVYTQIGTVGANVTTYSDANLSSTANVGYRVKATNSVGDSNYTYTWVYSGWTETNFQTAVNLPLYTYFEPSDLRATINAQNNHVTVNNDSTHGQDLTINVDVSAEGSGGNFYIYFFYQNANNWYRLNDSSTSCQFEKDVNGTISQIGSAGTGVNVGGNLQNWVIAVTPAGKLQFIYNAGILDAMAVPTMVLNVSDTLSFTSGKIGLGGTGGSSPIWQNFSFNTISSPTYALTVNNGSGSGNYTTGQTVTVTANAPPSGQQFIGWTGAHGILANASSATTTLTMPAEATTITPNYAVVSTASPLIANGTYEITAQNSGLALDISGSAVVQNTYTSAATQQWTVTNLYNNVVELTCSGNGKALDVPLSSTSTGTWLDVVNYTGEPNQQWTLISVGNGYYEIVNVNSDLEANVGYGSTAPGIGIDQWSLGNIPNGVFAFTPIGGGTPPPAPAAPTGLTAMAGNTQVSLIWTASSGATSYNVYRGTSAGGESTTAIATGLTSTSYTNTGLTNGTAYYYEVAAVNSSATSGYSNEANATPIASGGGGTSIGVQFVGSGTALAATNSAGVPAVAQTHWTTVAGSSFSSVALSDSTGTSTTAILSGGADGVYRGGGALTGGDASLVSGELFDGDINSETHAVTISSIPYAAYDVYVYGGCDASGRNATFTVTPSGGTASSKSFLTTNSATAWIEGTNTWNGSGTAPTLSTGNYVHFSGLTTASFTLKFGGVGNVGMNGIQIVPTAPSITSSTTATGTDGTAFSYQIIATTNPTSYSTSTLPTGLKFSTSTGLISGTPTVSGTFPIMISATSPSGTTTVTLTLTFSPAVQSGATDTPTLPLWGLPALALLLAIAAGRNLPSGRQT